MCDMSLACSLRVLHTPRSIAFLPHPAIHHRVLVERSCRVLDQRTCCGAACFTASQSVSQQDYLQSWTQQRAKQLQNCRVDSERDVPVLLSSTSAQAGQTLLSVPESTWISLQTVRNSPIGSSVEALEPWLQLALFILFGLADQKSDWSDYLLSLPSSFSVPLLWEEQELALLEGTQLLSTVQGYRDFFEDRWQDLNDNLFSQAPSLFPQDSFSYDRFLWAVATLRAHVHAPLQGAQVALVPLADLVQHARDGNAHWKLQPAGFGRHQSLLVESKRELRAGTPLTMDFGPDKSDAQILLDYGVLDADNPQAGFMLPLALPEGDACYDDKADIAELNGLQDSADFVLHPDQPPTNELMAFLRLVNISGPDAFLMEALFRNEVWGHMQVPVSRVNEEAVCQSMIDGCREALRGYPSTIDEDLMLLRDAVTGSREDLAIRVRLGEKETLDVTLRYFEDRKSKLDRLEYYQERRLKGLGLLDDDGNNTWDDFFKDSIA
ncbi:hypothetical protein ABBQ32_011210 [Trebouxia sp. C0010 RCD-2024]